MKKVLFLMLFLMILGTAGLIAQVTIGSSRAPHAGAVLDLQSTSKGLKLPVVSITDANDFQLLGDNSDAIGMIVYNSNASIANGRGAGLYVWDGAKWLFVAASSGAPVSVTTITFIPDERTVAPYSNLQLAVSVQPANATNPVISWSVIPGSGDGSISASGLFTSGISGLATVRAAATDGSGVYSEITVSVSGPTTYQGYNVYCYPNHLGCWTENVKTGTPSYTTYSGHDEGERGYYYTQDQALDACNALSGYSLPNNDQWNALKPYINGSSATVEEKDFFLSESAKAGYYSGSTPGYWDSSGYWWSSNANSHFSTHGGSALDGPHSNNQYFTVRCIKSN